MEETGKNTNSCNICFDILTDVLTARPDVCDHVYCLECLQTWVKHGNFCPVDRKKFKKIVNTSDSTEIPIKPKKRKKQPDLYDVSSLCEICKDTNSKEVLILCDSCDLAYHLTCLTPPLLEVPPGIWHCPECVAVTEKLKTNKDLVKGQKSIERDHSNLKSLSSTSSHKSCHEKYQKYNKSKNNRLEFVSEKRAKVNKKTKRSMNLLSKKRTLQTRSHSSNHEDVNQISSLSRNLRRRLERKKYFWDSSSEDLSDNSVVPLSSESCSSNVEQEHVSKKNFLKRKKNLKENIIDNSCVDVPECSLLLKSQKKISRQRSSTAVSSSKPFSVSDFDFSRPLDLTSEKVKDNDLANVIASMEYRNCDGEIGDPFLGGDPVSVDSTPCVIASAISLKERDCNLVEAGKKALKVDKLRIRLNLTPESENLDDDVTVIKTVRQEPSINELKVLNISDDFPKSSIEENSNGDVQSINFNLEGSRESIQNYKSNKMCSLEKGSSVLTVFERLEDENSSQKKYSELHQDLQKTRSNRHTNHSDILHRAFKHSSAKRFNDDYSTGAYKFSTELKKIDKRKSRHSLSDKQLHSCIFQSCRGIGTNPYSSNDVVRVGKHFDLKKYSDSFKEFQSIAKPLWPKTTYSESDVVILNRRNLAVQCCRKEVKSEHLSNIADSCHPSTSLKADCFERFPNHEIISVDSESLLYLANHEENLLRSAFCLSNNICLSFNKDGFLCADSKKRT